MKRFLLMFAAMAVMTAPVPVLANAAKTKPAKAAPSEGIVAVVNSDAVSGSDLYDRMKLMIVSSGMPNTPEIQERLKGQVLGMLIDESIQIQAAREAKLNVTQEEIDSGFATIAQQNNMQPEQFREILKRSGIPLRTLQSQIRAQLAWGKVVQRKLRPQIDVTEADIDERLRFLETNIGKTQFQVAEIFLPVEAGTQEGEVRALAERLRNEITNKRAPFPQVANQFSQGASAARGGDLGWVQDGQLPDALNDALQPLKDGELTAPVRSLTGYHILLLRGKRSVAAENIPPRDQILQQIGTERLERAQRRHLMDLRAEAFIERRI